MAPQESEPEVGKLRRFETPMDDSYITDRTRDRMGEIILRELSRRNGSGSLLDLGCGRGELLELISREMPERFSLTGVDRFFSRPPALHAVEWLRGDLNLEFPRFGRKFDVVLCTEVIEHVIDTDEFVRKLKAALKPGGILVLTTPNLASLFNRLLLLVGAQPMCTEVSWLNPYLGREWIYSLLGRRREPAAGHLRLFTTAALRDFLKFHGFEVETVRGFSYWGGFLGGMIRIFSVFPSLMPGNLVVARLPCANGSPKARGSRASLKKVYPST